MISVIIPTYKFQDYIWECLQSLEKQTLNPDEFEVIIVLNGSSPSYHSLLQEYIACKCSIASRVRILYIDIAGVSNARNIGLDAARGEYILFLDDDDVVSSNYLEKLYCLAAPHTVVVSNVLAFKYSISEKIEDYLTFKRNKRYGLFFNRCYLSNACCKLIPRVIIGNKRFDVGFCNGEDALFMFAISDKIAHLVKASEDCIYYRRLREGSASRGKKKTSQRVKGIIQQQLAYTSLYICGFYRYNFFLYLSRLLAVLKQ